MYCDDSEKPPVGLGLNKRAIVKLNGYWPTDKSTRQPIKDPEHVAMVSYVATLKKSTAKIGATFIDYIPVTGTCVFEVSVTTPLCSVHPVTVSPLCTPLPLVHCAPITVSPLCTLWPSTIRSVYVLTFKSRLEA